MKIDRRLHLVIPIYSDDDEADKRTPIAYVHSTPLSEHVVERYYVALGQTYAAIFSQGFNLYAGPSYAMRILKDVAQKNGTWLDDPARGIAGVENGLVEEMRRTTMVAVLNKETKKWDQLPLSVSVERGYLSLDDKREVENAIVFFTATSATLNRELRRPILEAAAGLWGAQISFLDFTAYMNFLKTSTSAGNTGESQEEKTASKPSSVPY